MRQRNLRITLALLAALAAIALARSVVIVDQGESAYVTAFGRPVRLVDQPGLHLKWPHQGVRTFDRRLQLDTPPPRELLTRDKKNLEVAWYASWRIADVERFLRTARTIPDASARLEDMAASVLAAELGGRELGQLVAIGEPSPLDAMMETLTARVAEQAASEYGLEVVAIRLRRLNYPPDVRPAVFEQIRSERQRVAAATRAEGESQARTIRSAADRERAAVIARAESDAARLIGQGEAEAARILNEAQAADPAFYQFLKTLETYRAALDSRTTLVLSADSPFLRLLTRGIPEPAVAQPDRDREGSPVAASVPAGPQVLGARAKSGGSNPPARPKGGRP